jgi:hypothetical protein
VKSIIDVRLGVASQIITLSIPPRRIWDGNRTCHRVRATEGVRFCRLLMLATDCTIDVHLGVVGGGQIVDAITLSTPPRICTPFRLELESA